MQQYTKMRIPNKRYQTNTVRTFWGTCSASVLRYLSLDHFGRYRTKIEKYNWGYRIRDFSVLDKLVRLCICSQHRVFPLSCWYFPVVREAYTVLRVEVKIFSWCSHGLPLIERNLKKWILSMKSSYKMFQKMHVIKAAWVKHYALRRFDSIEPK